VLNAAPAARGYPLALKLMCVQIALQTLRWPNDLVRSEPIVLIQSEISRGIRRLGPWHRSQAALHDRRVIIDKITRQAYEEVREVLRKKRVTVAFVTSRFRGVMSNPS
jgi:hypothetical protein